jgi:hypothetical protein
MTTTEPEPGSEAPKEEAEEAAKEAEEAVKEEVAPKDDEAPGGMEAMRGI